MRHRFCEFKKEGFCTLRIVDRKMGFVDKLRVGGWVGVGFAMHVIHSCLETVLDVPTVKLQLMW